MPIPSLKQFAFGQSSPINSFQLLFFPNYAQIRFNSIYFHIHNRTPKSAHTFPFFLRYTTIPSYLSSLVFLSLNFIHLKSTYLTGSSHPKSIPTSIITLVTLSLRPPQQHNQTFNHTPPLTLPPSLAHFPRAPIKHFEFLSSISKNQPCNRMADYHTKIGSLDWLIYFLLATVRTKPSTSIQNQPHFIYNKTTFPPQIN